MRKICTYIMVFFFIFVLSTDSANAECAYADKTQMNKKAANVKIKYEILSEKKDVSNDPNYNDGIGSGAKEITLDYFNLNIINISEELYIERTDSDTGEVKSYSAVEATNGVITERIDDLSAVKKYSYKIYASDQSACPGIVLKTTYITLPRYNEFSETTTCSDENLDFYLCKKYVMIADITEDDFINKLENYQSGNTNKEGEKIAKETVWYESLLRFVADYKYYIGGSVLIVIIAVLIFRTVKTKKQRELGL